MDTGTKSTASARFGTTRLSMAAMLAALPVIWGALVYGFCQSRGDALVGIGRIALAGSASMVIVLIALIRMLREDRRRSGREQALRDAHTALTHAEANFRGVFESSPDVLCVYRIAPDGSIILEQMNPAAAASRGLDQSAIGRSLEQLLPAPVFAEAKSAIDQVAASGAPVRLRTDRGMRGTDNEIDIVPLLRGSGAHPVDRVFVSVRDIRHLRDAQAAVAASEARFRLLAENTSELIILGHDDGRRAYISPASNRLLGFTPDELAAEMRGKRWVHPEDVDHLAAAQLSGEGVDTSVSCRVRRKDGAWIWVEAIFRRIETSGADEPTIIATFRDVTERHTQADALRQARDAADAARLAAEQASRAKSDFLATMSHEIRTPLNGILGFADLLEEDLALSPDSRRYLERIQNAGSALRTVVNDVLDFSQLEAGEISLERTEFSVAALIDNATSIVRGFAQSKRLDLIVSLDATGPDTVVGDHDRLRQILLNLLNNAVKFTPQGSVTVAVHASACADGRVKLRFSVADTGIGIAEDKHSRLFQRFSQVDGSIRRAYGGTGLGLAICRNLVEAMGGSIGVESAVGRGSTFWFELFLPNAGSSAKAQTRIPPEPETSPFDELAVDLATATSNVDRAKARGSFGDTLSRSAPASLRSLDILLVEDVALNQELIGTIIRARGHRVDVVGDGSEALMAVEDKTYDLLLMDVQMPHVDGITATRLIRNIGKPCRFVPIVGITAAVLKDQVAAARSAGMDDVLPKPLSLVALEKLLRRASRREVREAVDPAAFDQATADQIARAIGDAKVMSMRTLLVQSLTARFTEALAPETMAPLKAEAHASIAGAAMLGFQRFGALCRAFVDAPDASADAAYLAMRHELYHVVMTIEGGAAPPADLPSVSNVA